MQPPKKLDDGRVGYGVTYKELCKILWEEKISNHRTVDKWIREWKSYNALEEGISETGRIYLFRELEDTYKESLERKYADAIPPVKVVC